MFERYSSTQPCTDDVMIGVSREDREITVQEPRTVMETRSVQVPMTMGSMSMGYGMPYGTVAMPMNYNTVPSAPPTDPSLVFQAPNDDAISA